MNVDHVARQPTEIRLLFNPVMLSPIIWRLIKERFAVDGRATHISELAVLMALLLHVPTKKKVPVSKINKFDKWVRDNEDIKINLYKRVDGLSPYIMSGTMFGFDLGYLKIDQRGRLLPGDKKPKGLIGSKNDIMIELDKKARYLGASLPSLMPTHSFLTFMGLSL